MQMSTIYENNLMKNDGRDVEPGRKITNKSKRKRIFMDEALSKTNFGIFNYILILVAGWITTAVLLETCGIAYVIPVSQCDFQMTAGEKGALSGASFLGIICSSHLWGYLADTKGRHRIITPTLFVGFLLTCASSLVQNLYVFIILRFLNGFFMSGSAATIFVYISEFHDNKQRTRTIMASSVMYGMTLIFVPLTAYLVINQEWQFYIPFINITYKPWRLFIVVCGIPSAASFITLLFLPESPKFILSQGNKEQAYEIIAKMYRINNGKQSEFEIFEIFEEPESVENRQRILKCRDSRFPLLKSIWIQTAPLFKRPHLFSTALLCFIQFGVFATSNGFYIFVVEILNKMSANLDSFIDQRISMCDAINMKPINVTTIDLHAANTICMTKLEIPMIQQETILEIVFGFGSLLIGLLVNKLGKFPILFSVLVVCGSGGFVCMLTDIPLVQISAFLTVVSCGFATAILNAATVDLYPTASRAMALCISLMAGRIGCVVGANIAALLLENNCETVFYLSGGSLIAIGVLTFFIPNIHVKCDSNEIVLPNQARLSVISAR